MSAAVSGLMMEGETHRDRQPGSLEGSTSSGNFLRRFWNFLHLRCNGFAPHFRTQQIACFSCFDRWLRFELVLIVKHPSARACPAPIWVWTVGGGGRVCGESVCVRGGVGGGGRRTGIRERHGCGQSGEDMAAQNGCYNLTQFFWKHNHARVLWGRRIWTTIFLQAHVFWNQVLTEGISLYPYLGPPHRPTSLTLQVWKHQTE